MQLSCNDRLITVCRKNDVIFLGLFGSHSRNEATDESDIDLLAKFSKRKSLPDLVRIEREFSEILDRKVDLLTEGSISPYLTERVKKEVQVIYEG
jgi:predicted nucleotidyltransferase